MIIEKMVIQTGTLEFMLPQIFSIFLSQTRFIIIYLYLIDNLIYTIDAATCRSNKLQIYLLSSLIKSETDQVRSMYLNFRI